MTEVKIGSSTPPSERPSRIPFTLVSLGGITGSRRLEPAQGDRILNRFIGVGEVRSSPDVFDVSGPAFAIGGSDLRGINLESGRDIPVIGPIAVLGAIVAAIVAVILWLRS